MQFRAGDWAVSAVAFVAFFALVGARYGAAVYMPRFGVELLGAVGLLVLALAAYGFEPDTAPMKRLEFLHCIGIDLLLGFDNFLDIVGWYGDLAIPARTKAGIVLLGGVFQSTLRLALIPPLLAYLGMGEVWRMVAGVVIMVTGCRSLYLAMKSRDRTMRPDVEADTLPRAAFVESIAVVADLDSVVAKMLITRDVRAITLSAAACSLIPRALAIILLSLPGLPKCGVFFAVAGVLMLNIGAHALWPAIPELPQEGKLVVTLLLYLHLLVTLARELPAKDLPLPAGAKTDAKV